MRLPHLLTSPPFGEGAVQLYISKHFLSQIIPLNTIKHYRSVLNIKPKADVEDPMPFSSMKHRSFSTRGEGDGG